MKTAFVIKTHSFVDLITNSSSELFICDTKKTVDMVKELLQTLLDTHNKLSECPAGSFDECFGKIEVAKYTFDINNAPAELVEKYLSYANTHSWNSDSVKPKSYETAYKKEMELRETHPYHTTKFPSWDKMTPDEKIEQDKLHKDWVKKYDALYTKFGSEKLKIRQELFIYFLETNGFSAEQIEEVKKQQLASIEDHIKNKRGQHIYYYEGEIYTGEVSNAYQEFSENLSWNIVVEKGNIVVYSNSDNTIPYELFEIIESYLNASRYHLG